MQGIDGNENWIQNGMMMNLDEMYVVNAYVDLRPS